MVGCDDCGVEGSGVGGVGSVYTEVGVGVGDCVKSDGVEVNDGD